MSVHSLIDDWQTFGLVFENLCMRDLGVYARALPGAKPVPIRYYRDDSGLETDAIIELSQSSLLRLYLGRVRVGDEDHAVVRDGGLALDSVGLRQHVHERAERLAYAAPISALIMERDRYPEREPEIVERIRTFATRFAEACKG